MVRRIFIVLPVVAVILVLGGRYIGNADERVIQKRLKKLADTVEVHGPESPVTAGLKARTVASYFTPDARLATTVASPSVQGRSEVASTVLAVRRQLDRMTLKLDHPTLTVSPDRRTARVRLGVTALVAGSMGREQVRRLFILKWIRQDGQWLIQQVEPYDTITRPDR